MKSANGAELSANADGPPGHGMTEERSRDNTQAEPASAEPQNSENNPGLQVEVGDVWWIPEQFNGYPGGKGRFCLVVALQKGRALALPGRAHFVPGSTKPGRSKNIHPEIVLQAGEAGLRELTYFSETVKHEFAAKEKGKAAKKPASKPAATPQPKAAKKSAAA